MVTIELREKILLIKWSKIMIVIELRDKMSMIKLMTFVIELSEKILEIKQP